MRVSIRNPITKAKWVVVCNDLRAQVFEWVAPEGPLLQLQILVHSAGRGRSPDLPPEVERQIFAREVAGFLSSRAHRGEFADLVLVAPPRFLGLLRELLSGLPPATVLRTVDKDLTAVKPRELMKTLENALTYSLS